MLRTLVGFAAVATLVAACDQQTGPYVVTELDVPSGVGARFPFLASDTSGRTILTWTGREDDSTAYVRFAERAGSGDWKRVYTLARDSALMVNWADFATVVPMDDGRLVAQWMKRGTERHAYELSLAQSVNGGDIWSTPVVPHGRARQGEHGFVSMFSIPGGGTAVQFLDGTFAPDSAREMVLQHVVFDTLARIVAGHPLDARVCDCCQTDAAVTTEGPVVVYRDRSPEEIRDISIVRRTGDGWTAPVRVHPDEWRIEGCPVNGPAVAAAGTLVAVAWFTAARDTARVRLAFSRDAGATFGPPIELDSGPTALGRVDVALAADGRAMVSWLHRHSRHDAEVRIAAVDADSGTVWSASLGRTDAARPSGFPRVTRSGAEILVAWTETGSATRVRLTAVAAR